MGGPGNSADAAPSSASDEAARRAANAALLRYTRETNDTLFLAAKVVAMVVAAAEQRRKGRTAQVGEKRPRARQDAVAGEDVTALLEAWQPFRYVHKALWWECTRSPEDGEEDAQAQDSQQEEGHRSASSHACHAHPPGSFAGGVRCLGARKQPNVVLQACGKWLTTPHVC